MRHNKKFNHLGRKSAHRNAMLSNMACSLILHKRISTTTAKAKALKSYVEPLITKSKDDTTQNRRVVFSYLKSKTSVSELFRDISPKIADRPGGYTRILKTETRAGDSAEMCILELVDYNENMLAAKDDKKAASRRRRGAKKKAEAPVASAPKKAAAVPVAKVEDAKVVEEAVEETPEAVVEETPEAVVEETPEVIVEETATDVAEETATDEADEAEEIETKE
jgi:large subunit ribosomal protein L17